VEKINGIISYTEDNISEDIDISIPAKSLYCSKYEFQRIFSFIVEIPIFEYIKKRRLTLAGHDIQNSEEKIIDIALKYGYESHSSFSRSFKNFHGITPSEARSNPKQPIKIYSRFSLLINLEE
jgi:AraC family transcriptional regulator